MSGVPRMTQTIEAAYERDGAGSRATPSTQEAQSASPLCCAFGARPGDEHAPARSTVALPVLLQLPVQRRPSSRARRSGRRERAEGRPAAHGAEADYEAQGYGADKRHDKELQRLHKALVRGRILRSGTCAANHSYPRRKQRARQTSSAFGLYLLGKLRRAHSWAMRAAETP